MIKNKKELEEFLKAYNFCRTSKTELVLAETDKFIKLELGEYWITKHFVANPNDKDYGILFMSFFKFMCFKASESIPENYKSESSNVN